ncbi:MAG: membrane lipoprotein lipid attachment site-containing protein [Deltaproteobacteria bacterium]|nr:membrane lipoprotein lipid attachment site-containing protein [Deltaproteobacteria bacterium]
MKRIILLLVFTLVLSGCLPRLPKNIKSNQCHNITFLDNICLTTKTRILSSKDKILLRQNIYIKSGTIRIDTLGVFDEVINTIIIKKDEFYVVDYQQYKLYVFTSEDEFYKRFNLHLPIFRLPFFLTLSDDTIPACQNLKEGSTKICGEEKIIIDKDTDECKYIRINYDSPTFGNLQAIYSDFSNLNGAYIFHKLRIKGYKNDISLDIDITKIQRGIKEQGIFEMETFKGFERVF